jgi:KDO2-lipid IV(A) lauroyltransferase
MPLFLKFQHWIEYIFLKTIIFIAHLFPLKFIIVISRYTAVLAYYFIPIRKKEILTSLKLSFPEKNEKDIKIIMKNTYINFLRT